MDLILVGFMGSGKTTIGQLLAEQLKTEYLDLDEMIVDQAGIPISKIFQEFGEAGFRKTEQDCLRTTERLSGVLSTGGGTPIPQANQRILKQIGAPIVLLTASIETILSRIADNSSRPLVNQLGATGLAKLLEQRQAAYLQISDFQFKTDRLSPSEVAEQIMTQVQVVK